MRNIWHVQDIATFYKSKLDFKWLAKPLIPRNLRLWSRN